MSGKYGANVTVELLSVEDAQRQFKSMGLKSNEEVLKSTTAGVIKLTLRGDEYTQGVFETFLVSRYPGHKGAVANDVIASKGKNGHDTAVFFKARRELVKQIAGYELGGNAHIDGILLDISRNTQRSR